jgi:ribosome-binding factor A
MNPNRRLQRVAELLKREVSELIRRELTVEQIGLLTVNEIVVAKDLRTATVYLGFVGTREQKKNAPAKLEARTPRIQLLLGATLRLKFTPQLRFVLDDSVEKGNRVLAILDELERAGPGADSP